MTTLVVEELKTTLDQSVSLNFSDRYHVYAIGVHLYAHNFPGGIYTVSLIDPDASVVVEETFVSGEIYTALGTSNPYAQAYFRIILDDQPALPKGTYTLRLSSVGYTFSESSYMGWVRDHEDLKVKLEYAPESDLHNPLSYEVWVTI